jgi:hypothetical protein
MKILNWYIYDGLIYILILFSLLIYNLISFYDDLRVFEAEDFMGNWGPLKIYNLLDYINLHEPLDQDQLVAINSYNSKPNAVIYFLANKKNLIELKQALKLLHYNFNQQAGYPVVLFIEEEDIESIEEELLSWVASLYGYDNSCSFALECRYANQSLTAHLGAQRSLTPIKPWDSDECKSIPIKSQLCLPWPLIFSTVIFDFPVEMSREDREYYSNGNIEFNPLCTPTRLRYRHMCHVMTFIQYHPIFSSFDWYWRLDDDSEILASLPYNPFQLLQFYNKSFGWAVLDWEYKHCEVDFASYIDEYRSILTNSGDKIQGFDLFSVEDSVIFYNNFEIGSFKFWRDAQVRDFLSFIDKSQGTYRLRWGDALIRSAALSLFMPKDQLFYFSQIHYRHEKVVNFPEDSIQKQIWRRFLHANISYSTSFHLASLFIYPFLFLLLGLHLRWEFPRLEFLSMLRQDVVNLKHQKLPHSLYYSTPHISNHSAKSHQYRVEYLRLFALIAAIVATAIKFSQTTEIEGISWLILDITSFSFPSLLFAAGYLFPKDSSQTNLQLFFQFSKDVIPPYFIAILINIIWNSAVKGIDSNNLLSIFVFGLGNFILLSVLFYLNCFSLLIRNWSFKYIYLLLAISLSSMILFYEFSETPMASAWIQFEPAVNFFPFILGWVVNLYNTNNIHLSPALHRAKCYLLLFAECTRSVIILCIIISSLSIISVERRNNLFALDRNVVLQYYNYAIIYMMMLLSTKFPAPSNFLLALNSNWYNIYIFHFALIALMSNLVVDNIYLLILSSILIIFLVIRLISAVQPYYSPHHFSRRSVYSLMNAFRNFSFNRKRIILAAVTLLLAPALILLLINHNSEPSSNNLVWRGSIFEDDYKISPECLSYDNRIITKESLNNLPASTMKLITSSVSEALHYWEHNPSAPMITRSLLMNYMKSWYSHEVTFVQIYNGSINVWSHNEFELPEAPFGFLINHRRRSFLDLVHKLIQIYGNSFPNLEFALSTLDCCVEYLDSDPNKFWGYDRDAFFIQGISPAFTVVHCSNSANIVVPMRDDRLGNYNTWESTACAIAETKKNFPPLQQRIQRAVLRGEVRACHLNASDEGLNSTVSHSQFMFKGPQWRECGRSGLVWRAFQRDKKPFLYDIQLGTDIEELDRLMKDHSAPGTVKKLSMIDHQKYVAIIYAHGQCHWANRLEELLWMSSVILLQVGQCKQFYALGLQPWVHYIPVDYNFNNMTNAIEWVIDHIAESETIIHNMNNYAREMVSYISALKYTELLLRRYSTLMAHPIEPISWATMHRYNYRGHVYNYPDQYICSLPRDGFRCYPWSKI